MRTSQIIKNRYTITAGVLTYAVQFPMYTDSDVAVYLSTDEGKTESLLTLNSDYTVSRALDNQSGTVTLANGVASAGDIIALVSNLSYTQELDLSSVSAIDTEAMETQLDRDCQQRQQINDLVARSIKLTATSPKTADEFINELFTAKDTAVSSAAAAAGSALSASNSAGTATNKANDAESSATAANNSALDAAASAAQAATIANNSMITATGSTTARALADRFADVVNVRDFGAKGDGVVNRSQKPLVFIVAGQSNAEGSAGALDTSISAINCYYWDNSTTSWKTPVVDPVWPSSTGGFIPHVADFYDHKDRPLYFINVAVGNTICATQTAAPHAGTWASTGNLRGRALGIISAALGAISENYDIVGTIWLQGESDAEEIYNNNETTSDFSASLADTISWFITNVGGKFFAVSISYNSDTSNDTAVNSVNSAIETAVSNNNNAYLVTDRAKTFRAEGHLRDKYHYTSEGYKIIGHAIAVGIRRFISFNVLSATGTNNTAAFNNAISAAASAGKDLYIPSGTYCFDNSMNFSSVNNMKVYGDGDATLLVLTQAHHAIKCSFCTNMTFSDFSITTTSNATTGNTFQIENSTDCVFERLHITNAANDAICLVDTNYASFGSNACRSLRHTINRCKIIASRGGAGIRVLYSMNVMLTGSYVADNNHESICYDFGSYNGLVSNNNLRKNKGAGQISLDGGSGVIISSNYIVSAYKSGLPCITTNGNLEVSYGTLICSNRLYGGVSAIWTKGFQSALAPDPNSSTYYYGANRCLIIANSIRDAECGIRLEYRSKDNTMIGNSFVNCGRDFRNYAEQGYNWIIPERVGCVEMGEMAYPSTTKYLITPLPTSGEKVTATDSGWIEFFYNSTGSISGWRGCRNETTQMRNMEYRFSATDASKVYIMPVNKGDEFSVSYPGGTGHTVIFFKSKGQVLDSSYKS